TTIDGTRPERHRTARSGSRTHGTPRRALPRATTAARQRPRTAAPPDARLVAASGTASQQSLGALVAGYRPDRLVLAASQTRNVTQPPRCSYNAQFSTNACGPTEQTMKDSIRHLIQQALTRLVAEGVLPDGLTPAIQVENTRDKSHGDFASNIAMMLAKPAGMKPRDLAQKLIDTLPTDNSISKVEIAGPGFLNFFQNSAALAERLDAALASAQLGVSKTSPAQRVVVDLSSPNLAKEMHVGHLRSTIIGDAVGRVLEFLGDTVIRQNHVGDWGTQFGMLLAYLEENPASAEAELSDLEQFYRAAKQRFDDSEAFADRARELVVKLQAGDAECLRLWSRFNEISLSHCQKLYERLNVKLTPADVTGESAYDAELPGIVDALREGGLLTEDNGAQCVFLDEFKNAEGNPLPVIVQKAGGGYLYATTDLAAMRYRSQQLKADRALYFRSEERR